jgi:hypothetical protein
MAYATYRSLEFVEVHVRLGVAFQTLRTFGALVVVVRDAAAASLRRLLVVAAGVEHSHAATLATCLLRVLLPQRTVDLATVRVRYLLLRLIVQLFVLKFELEVI